MSARRFRKKPVVIEAVRFGGSSTQRHLIRRWMEGQEYVEPGMRTSDMCGMDIDTLEGTMRLTPGNWLVRGVEGEFYPVRHDIFMATYDEEVTDGSV